MPLGVKCRDAQFATCEQESRCTGNFLNYKFFRLKKKANKLLFTKLFQKILFLGASSECPRSPPMKDGTSCLERGQCRGGKCIPYCETQGQQSCMCDTPSTLKNKKLS